ncbi:DJ-1/PfpI family protein [Candidatus Roizmanbacteria bacterium]|nr:DJ-1/PfpI family protein [Candidatus Roizmanbacteria bacterium]
MKKALILTADQFEDMEVMYPLFRLQEAGWSVVVAAPKKDSLSRSELQSIRRFYIVLNDVN